MQKKKAYIIYDYSLSALRLYIFFFNKKNLHFFWKKKLLYIFKRDKNFQRANDLKGAFGTTIAITISQQVFEFLFTMALDLWVVICARTHSRMGKLHDCTRCERYITLDDHDMRDRAAASKTYTQQQFRASAQTPGNIICCCAG